MSTKIPGKTTKLTVKDNNPAATYTTQNLRYRNNSRTKLLLSCVFKPYGVNDDYGDELCSMELMNNQVTRGQGIHSPRGNNLSFGLYLLAENINVPSTVLDFPDWKSFTHEVDTGNYTHIGITFISTNVLKVQRMAAYIRKHKPNIIIILGGHGAAIPELKELVECDEVCYGEGVSWLRRYFGERQDKPIIHPVIRSGVNSSVYGIPLPTKDGIIITGVGCQNGCRFCSTSHKFDKKYTAFLKTGSDILNACNKQAEKLGVDHFGLMDENFCKNETQARQLLKEMEKEQKPYTFYTFSSAEAVTKLGVDFLVRLGVNLLWIGVESKAGIFEKTNGIDIKALFSKLQAHGISVLASTILFLEHHDKKNIIDEMNWAINLESDLLQFMQFGPIPGTPLFADYTALGKMIDDFPWKRKHGQDVIWFNHPNFTLPETSEYIIKAFDKKFQAHGPGILSMAYTAINGYLTIKKEIEEHEAQGLAWDPETLSYTKQQNPRPDHYMRLRLKTLKRNALHYRPILRASLNFAPNKQAAEKSRMVIDLFNKTFGPASLQERIKDFAVGIKAYWETRKLNKNGIIMRQPPVIRTKYKNHYAKEANTAAVYRLKKCYSKSV